MALTAAAALGGSISTVVSHEPEQGLQIGALTAAAIGLFGLSFVNPLAGLSVALVANYDPLFNYFYLYTREFEGGSLRALISLALMTTVAAAVLVRRFVAGGLSIPRLRLAPGPLAYVLLVVVGVVTGLGLGNDIRLIGSDLFPVVEFVGFFVLAAIAVHTPRQLRALCWVVVVWGGIAAGIDVAIYGFAGNQLVSHFALSGGSQLVKRLDDFMPTLILPLGVALLGAERAKFRSSLLSLLLMPMITATVLSFFRTLWLGSIVATLLLVAVSGNRSALLKRLVATVAVTAAILGVAGGTLLASVAGGDYSSLADLVVGRIAYIEPTSSVARVEDNIDLLSSILGQPVFGLGLGGVLNGQPLFSTSNYYLSLTAELGVFAFLAFGATTLVFARRLLAVYRMVNSELRESVIGVAGSFAAMGVTLIAFPSLVHYPIPAYLGALAGSLVCVRPGWS